MLAAQRICSDNFADSQMTTIQGQKQHSTREIQGAVQDGRLRPQCSQLANWTKRMHHL